MHILSDNLICFVYELKWLHYDKQYQHTTILNGFSVYNNYIQTNQSQMLLNNSERFGLLLADNIEKVGSSQTVESENIGKVVLLHIALLH